MLSELWTVICMHVTALIAFNMVIMTNFYLVFLIKRTNSNLDASLERWLHCSYKTKNNNKSLLLLNALLFLAGPLASQWLRKEASTQRWLLHLL